MKHNKTLLIVLVIVLLLAVALYAAITLAQKNDEEQTDARQTELTVVKQTETENIVGFVLTNTEKTHPLALTEHGWVYNDDPNFPLNDDFVNQALETLCQIDAVKVVEYDAQELSAYGLDEPQMTVDLTEDGGQSTRFLIGNYNSFNGYYYMTVEGVGDVFMIDYDLVELCSSTQKDIIQLDSLPQTLTDAEVTSVTVSRGQSQTVYSADDESFDSLKTDVGALALTDYADYYLERDEYAEYGFDSAAVVTIHYANTVSSGDSSSTQATVSYDYTLTFGKADEAYLYFMVQDSEIVYRMKREALPAIDRLLA